MPPTRPLLRALAAIPAALLVACDSGPAPDADAGGTLVITTAADADFLLPPLVAGSTGRQVAAQLYERLAEIGDELNTLGDAGFEPRLAERWEWAADSLSIAFHLNPEARWHDGRPVTARDVRFSWQVYADSVVGSPSRPLIANIDSVTVRDSLTAVVWFARRSPEQFYEAVYQMHVLPEHVLGAVPRAELRAASAARQPVGSGRFRFVRWEPGQRIEIVADTTHYRGRPKLDRVIWTVAPDPTTAVTRLYAGEADFYEAIRADHLPELAKHADLRAAPYPLLAYGYLAFNFRAPGQQARAHPLLADPGVRRALAMAVNREALVKNVFDSLATLASGPVSSASRVADPSLRQIPFDPEGAKRLLDSLGWRDANGDGVREKGGRRLAFGILVPSSSKPRVNMAVLLQEQLKQVGAAVEVESQEFTSMLERVRQGKFDAMIGFWGTDPSPSGIRQTWMSPGSAGQGVSNFGSYASPVFDARVDSALAQTDPEAARAIWRRAFQTIVDDAGAIFLYEPRMMAGLHGRVRPARMRADAWWANLDEWTIDPARRIPRDAIGLGTVAARPATDSAAR